MAYDAKVIQIIIASPADVASERAIVRDVIAEWNAVYAADRSVVLLPIGWETHSSPELAGRPQQMINDRLLAHADLLVGIFWTRVGSPTGKAISGSIEEIQEHRRQGKPVMLYFSNVPVALDSVDQTQYGQLTEFKSWARGEGLVGTFESLEDFRQQFSRQLPFTLRDNPYLKRILTQVQISVPLAGMPVTPRQLPISTDARDMIEAAAKSQNNVVMLMRHLDGATIQAGEQVFGDSQNPRSIARYESAIKELNSRGFVDDINGKGQVFRITDAGYRAVEEGI